MWRKAHSAGPLSEAGLRGAALPFEAGEDQGSSGLEMGPSLPGSGLQIWPTG